MSGVLPSDECKATFLKLKEKRAFKFITFAIDEAGGVTNVCETCETGVSDTADRTPRQIFWLISPAPAQGRERGGTV